MKHLVFSAVMLASTMAHAGDTIIDNYDTNGNLIGHSVITHETDAQENARLTRESMEFCVKTNVELHQNVKCW